MTVGELIKSKDYDYIELKLDITGLEDIFVEDDAYLGCFRKNKHNI